MMYKKKQYIITFLIIDSVSNLMRTVTMRLFRVFGMQETA